MYLVDSREKRNDHVLRYFDKHAIEYEIRRIDTGDYMDTKNPQIRVERKQSLLELSHNLLSADRARFFREIRRARDSGIQLIILCEHGPDVKTFADVKNWKPKYGKVTGKALADAIFRLELSYGVPVYYCGKRSTGKRIVEILSQEETDGNENLLRGD